jgi:hypothetical protein
MSMHNQEGHNQHGGHGPEKVDASLGYESTDVGVTGIVVFLTALFIFVAVCGVLCFGIGKVFNAYMNKQDGPNTKWTKTADVRELGNLPSNPELQNKVAEMTKSFPTPRLLNDDGDQDVADLHAREDLLLDNYTWVDQSKGTVRIPVDRAMEIIAQQGLPVAPAAKVPQAQLMTGDNVPSVSMPLTNGFARTAFEQDEAAQEAATKTEQAAQK